MITAHGLERLGFNPYTDFILQDDSDGNGVYIAEWLSSQPQPSEADIEQAHAEWQAEYNANQYARDRATAYPPIGDQLDMIYHAGLGGDAFQAAISAVKQEYPK